MQRGFVFSVNEYYHLYNRGTDKKIIFKNSGDYERFIQLLYLCNGTIPVVYRELPKNELFSLDKGEQIVSIGAYCLMPNHFHILIREKTENGASIFMKKLGTAYSMYFNKKYERTGGLFEGPFKARHADKDTHLQYLFSYIHLNPAKRIDANWKTNMHKDGKRIFEYINRYTYSSWPDYRNESRKENVILSKEEFPDYFETEKDIERSLTDWLLPQGQSLV